MDREQLLDYAKVLLEPLSSLEMLCEADEKMDNTIFYMNRTALETMNFHTAGSGCADGLGPLHSPVPQRPRADS